MLRVSEESRAPEPFTTLGEWRCKVEEHMIPTSDGKEIRAWVYSPFDGGNTSRQHRSLKAASLPAFVFVHGGGWVKGTLKIADPTMRFLANKVHCKVVSIEYRLAPEHKFPRPLLDAYEAVKWVLRHGRSFGIDTTRVAIGGESAGGNIAASAALLLRDQDPSLPRLRHQLLVYPVTNYDFTTQSYEWYQQGYGLTNDDMQWYWEMYLPSPRQGSDWRASPLKATSFTGLPPATIVLAECDVLHDDGALYADAIRSAGGRVLLLDYPGMVHGFWMVAETYDAAKESLLRCSDELIKAFDQT
eukprot:CAMPEP_0184643988 /NCGR_PEP_ID=MMETSP0308-20130426/785_1 /TAXON_ID=38269 /ORGANISM="Gloeochaete witrockiana, Strain SAG 46.84" /LENGTH=300 /DNA_ID=CAMNT_0027072273 /DNA_START=319 /DNA_END=1221 /DNA_ORIENTATION=+